MGGQRYSFGLFALVIALIAFYTTVAGCAKKEISIPIPAIAADTTDTITVAGLTYMALGDSYTIGQNVDEDVRYPVQAAGMLTTGGSKVNKPDIIAVTGWTTDHLLEAIAAAKPRTDYDIVSLLIGVNDQYQLRDTTGYRDKFITCLNKAIALAAGDRNHVFVLSIPDYSVTPFGAGAGAKEIAKQIDQFNEINKSVTVAYGISYIDVTATSRQVKNDPGKQYKLWAELLAAAILLKLN
jgi:hypothetical protein